MAMKYQTYFRTPLGWCVIEASDEGVQAVTAQDQPPAFGLVSNIHTEHCEAQLQDYFAGQLKAFDVSLTPQGTEFQLKVWAELLKIPFGETRTYLQMARQLGDEKCIRAAAAANGKNPLWIIAPCHRVIGSDGSLTGYAGGLWRKKWLLDHERQIATGSTWQLF
jgi:methylated-DNA-[protein]-cysteine S-methyltransferase